MAKKDTVTEPVQHDEGFYAKQNRRYVGTKETVGYVIFDMAQSFNINSYSERFITTIFKMDLGLQAVANLINSIWDVVNDTFSGAIVDKTRTRWGKFKPYLIVLGIPGTIATCLYWLMPAIFPSASSTSMAKFFFYLVLAILRETGGTFRGFAQTGMLATITPNPIERTRLITQAQFFSGFLGENLPQQIMDLVLDLIGNQIIAKGNFEGAYDNITYAYDKAAQGNGFTEEFVLRAEDRERMKLYGKQADDLHTDLHECLGHGSGRLKEGVSPTALGSYSSTLEETRADLFGLYYIGDPKMIELGLVPSFELAKAAYADYIMNGMMTQLSRIEPGKQVEESHMRNRKLIAEWCYEQGKAENVIEWVVENDKRYIVVNNFERLRELFGEMLHEIQRIKSEGDFEAGKALVEQYAVQVDPELHREVLARYQALKIEPYGGFVNPEYEPVYEDDRLVDVKISYPANYVEQMLNYAANYSFLPNIN